MITASAISALKHHIEEIFKAEGHVRIVCNRHTYYMDKDKLTSCQFDGYGIALMGRIYCTYQGSCSFGRVYIPFESITTLTGDAI